MIVIVLLYLKINKNVYMTVEINVTLNSSIYIVMFLGRTNSI